MDKKQLFVIFYIFLVIAGIGGTIYLNAIALWDTKEIRAWGCMAKNAGNEETFIKYAMKYVNAIENLSGNRLYVIYKTPYNEKDGRLVILRSIIEKVHELRQNRENKSLGEIAWSLQFEELKKEWKHNLYPLVSHMKLNKYWHFTEMLLCMHFIILILSFPVIAVTRSEAVETLALIYLLFLSWFIPIMLLLF